MAEFGIDDASLLAEAHPEIALQIHPTLNGDLDVGTISRGAGRKIWWLCSAGHEWQAPPNERTSPQCSGRCPYCAGRRITPERSFAHLHQSIAAELHPTRNGSLDAFAVSPGSNRKLWWRCDLGHEWRTAVAARVSGGTGCPWCSGLHTLPERSLAALHPDVAAELHPTRNGSLDAFAVSPGSARKLWWRCDLGHSWQAPVTSRKRRNHGCPWCSGRRYLLREDVFAWPMSGAALYHLGLLAADGCVSDQGQINLGLQAEDRAALARFARFCGLTSERVRVASDSFGRVAFTSRRMAADLAAHGIVPRKSRVLNIGAEARVHAAFWLGYFDGDGTAMVSPPALVWISGSERAMQQCADFWAVELGRRPAVSSSPSRGTYSVCLGGSSAQHAAEILLAACDESLERKRVKLQQIAAYRSSRVRARLNTRARRCAWCCAEVMRPPSWEAHLKHVFCNREHYLRWRRTSDEERESNY